MLQAAPFRTCGVRLEVSVHMAGKSKLSGSQISLMVGGGLVVIGAGVFAAMWMAKGQDGKQAVCQFDSPGSLGVSLKGAPQMLYAPGIGHSAAILRKGDQLTCVIAPRLTVDAG